MDWQTKAVGDEVPGYSKALADDQQAYLRGVYERIANLYEAIEHFELATFRGYSICQPHGPDAGNIERLECLDHWNFLRDGRYGPWGWNPSAQGRAFAALPSEHVLDDTDIVVLEHRRPVDRIGLIKYVRQNLSEKDWDAYIEIYGVPAAFVIGPENVPEGKTTEYKNAAQSAAEGGGGYLPHGSDVKFPDGPRGSQPFDLRLKHLSEKLVLAGTGGMLTMLTESGSGTLAGGAHQEAFKSIVRGSARKISELFQRRIDAAALDAKFPGRPRLAYFTLLADEERDVGDIVSHIAQLASAGLQMDPADASERTGYNLTAKPAAPPGEPSTPFSANRERTTDQTAADDSPENVRSAAVAALGDRVNGRLIDTARDALARAAADDLLPVRERIEAALAIDDDQAMLDALAKIPGDLPAMLEQICKAPASEGVIEQTLAAALLNGVAEGAATHADAESIKPATEEQL
jgi:hypothetical protein